MCHMSRVTCKMSGVRCQVSLLFFFFLFYYKMVELVDGGSVINGAYPVIFFYIYIHFVEKQEALYFLLYNINKNIWKLYFTIPSHFLPWKTIQTCPTLPTSLETDGKFKTKDLICYHLFPTVKDLKKFVWTTIMPDSVKMLSFKKGMHSLQAANLMCLPFIRNLNRVKTFASNFHGYENFE